MRFGALFRFGAKFRFGAEFRLLYVVRSHISFYCMRFRAIFHFTVFDQSHFSFHRLRWFTISSKHIRHVCYFVQLAVRTVWNIFDRYCTFTPWKVLSLLCQNVTGKSGWKFLMFLGYHFQRHEQFTRSAANGAIALRSCAHLWVPSETPCFFLFLFRSFSTIAWWKYGTTVEEVSELHGMDAACFVWH